MTTQITTSVTQAVAELLALTEVCRMHLDTMEVLRRHHLDTDEATQVRQMIRDAWLQEPPASDRADDLRLIRSTVNAYIVDHSFRG